jgi:hypothetical protein
MTRADCAEFNGHIQVAALREYWAAVNTRVRDVAGALTPGELSDVVDQARLREVLGQGVIGSERARWLESFLENRTKAWLLGFINWHTAEHLLGGAVSVRRISGIPLGL